jgi:hypothetical protein
MTASRVTGRLINSESAPLDKMTKRKITLELSYGVIRADAWSY